MLKFPFLTRRPRDYAIERLGPEDVADAARIHREDFTRAWSEDEFDGLLAQQGVFGFAARQAGSGGRQATGFVLVRTAAGEGEILTIAVEREHRREGIGWRLLDAVLRELHGQRAQALFLEVDETNAPALALYRRLGFVQVGRRPGYYQAAGKPATGALVMRRDLR